jgi:hypothetical protein
LRIRSRALDQSNQNQEHQTQKAKRKLVLDSINPLDHYQQRHKTIRRNIPADNGENALDQQAKTKNNPNMVLVSEEPDYKLDEESDLIHHSPGMKRLKNDTHETVVDVINAIFNESGSDLTPTQDLSPFLSSIPTSGANTPPESFLGRSVQVKEVNSRKSRSNVSSITSLLNPFRRKSPQLGDPFEDQLFQDMKAIRQS